MKLVGWLSCLALLLMVVPARAQEKELNIFAWSEYIPQAVIDGFTQETGIKVTYETYASNEEMLTKLLAGASNYDLIQPSEYTTEALIKQGLLSEIDHAKLKNFKNLDPKYTNMAHDPECKHSVPWMVGLVCIVVNTDKVKEPVKGFADVFQEKHKGRIVVVDDAREMVSWALAVKGIPTNDITPENLEKVKPLIADWVKLIRSYDSDSPKTSMLNGDTDIGIVWSGEAATLVQEDKKFQFVLPNEGTHMFLDSLAIPKNAKHKDAAMAFIDYILRPEVSKLISEDFPYTNPNTEARKLLTPEQLDNPASYPKGDPKLEIFRDIGKAQADVERLVQDLKG